MKKVKKLQKLALKPEKTREVQDNSYDQEFGPDAEAAEADSLNFHRTVNAFEAAVLVREHFREADYDDAFIDDFVEETRYAISVKYNLRNVRGA